MAALVASLAAISVLIGCDGVRGQLPVLMRLMQAPQGARVWGTGVARVSKESWHDHGSDSVCDVRSEIYVSGKSGGWRDESRHSFVEGTPRLELAGGRVLRFGADPIRFVPHLDVVPDPALADSYRQRWPSFAGPRLYEQCLVDGAEFFVDACIVHNPDGDTLVACAGEPAVLLTRGKRGARLAEHVGLGALGLGLVVLGLAALGWVVVERLRGRSAESALGLAVELDPRATLAFPSPFASLTLLLRPRFAATLAFPLAFVVLAFVSDVPHAVAACAFCIWGVTLLVSLSPLARLSVLRRLRRRVVDTPTDPLSSAQGDALELQVRVAPDAETFAAPLSGERVAHASLRIWEQLVTHDRNSKSISYVQHYIGVFAPLQLAIEDASGRGAIDLEEAILDLDAYETVASVAQLPAAIIEHANLYKTNYLVRESVLRPGDSLYVRGSVQRSVDPRAEGRLVYRAAPTRVLVSSPRTHARERLPLFVHAGTQSTLLAALARGQRRERWFAASLAGVVASATLLLMASVVLCLL